MVSDVTVHEPIAWVIGFESDDHIAAIGICRSEDDIAAGWVAPVRFGCNGGGGRERSGIENGEVVAVEVHL